MAAHPTRDDFARHVNTLFRLGAAGEDGLTLVEVSALRSSPRHESFSLLFRGVEARPLPQATWTLGHAALGELDIFLVPVGQDERGRYYEAVFNRLVPPDPARG
jgi:hypothetical protein